MSKIYGSFPNRVADFPDVECWAIVKNSSYYVPGDERSRTNPGHGYPEGTEYVLLYEVFTDEEQFKKEVIRLTKESQNSWKAIHILPVSVIVTVDVKVGS